MEENKKKKEDQKPPPEAKTEATMAEVKTEAVSAADSESKDSSSSNETKVKSEAKPGTSAAGTSGSANADDGEMDEAGMRRALQEYMAMAQTVQSAQQLALASGLIQAFGSQAVAYLQASAVTGKPLASMLSMAMLQQAQQQQQQQAAAAAALSLMPKRGRGSRGGSTGVRRGGASVGLKLKRLDSGEFVRGSGRGRGSRGRRRLEGSYSNEFLYYMNEGGIRSGSNIGPTGSPSRLVSTSSGDGSPYDMLEQEELLYTENYPGKLCALCNLSERSTLGQGDIIKMKISEEIDQKSLEEKRKNADQASGSAGATDPEDPLANRSPQANLLARRKGRKLTSGDTYEPFDELENVGFSDEPDLTLVFETSGHFYVHENCAIWSHGVSKNPVKEEANTEKTPEKGSKKWTESLQGIDKAVSAAINQKCMHCKHYGASVRCKASGKMYHFPCAAASGSFMHKPTLTLVGTDSLSKVSGYADNAMYLYHDGTWKFGKVGDLKVDKFDNLLYCTTCGQHYYYTGAHVRISAVIRAGWQCQKCKWCQICRQTNQDDRYLLCDVCDGAFHAHCLRPQMASIPKNGWKCKLCRKCTDCGSRTPGSGQSSRWHANYTVCDSCYQQRNKGLACPICGRAYRHSAQKEMMQCSTCKRHVHSQCDSEANEQTFLEKRAQQFNYMYSCKVCKGQAQRAATMATSSAGNTTPSITSPREGFSDECLTPDGKSTSWPASGDNSFEDDKVFGGISGATGSGGMGRGKPMSALAGKRKRMAGIFAKGQKPDLSPSHPGSSPPMTIIDKKRANEVRRRGRQPKIRGMVGLQRPQADPGVKDDEEDSKMVCVSVNDDFVLKQDICVMCGAIGTDLEGRLIACTQCGECYHPHCINVRVTKVILQKGWRCLDCTVCEGCGLKHDEANLILCDECDISYHIYCMNPPLEQVPMGTWKCKWCAVCHQCGSHEPGVNSSWFDNFSMCGPCQSLRICNMCEEGYEDGEMIISCGTCKRWCHAECDSIQTEEDAEKCSQEGYKCQLCRPPGVLPPHLANQKQSNYGSLMSNPGRDMTEYSSYSHYNSASFIVDGVILSERGMTTLKAQTVEREKTRRRKRIGMGGEGGFDPLDAGNNQGDDNDDNDDDDDIMPPPTPGGPAGPGGLGPKDGDIVRPLPDGRPPEAPDGFTVVQKDNGLMVLRKRRYRDLKKVGIGGFQAKQRTPSRKPKDEPETGPDGEKPKKRPAWRPKKNKLLVQYPEYIQDAFFGKDIMDNLDQSKNPEDFLEDTAADSKPGSSATTPESAEKKKPHGTGLRLNKDILLAIEEVRKKEEKERKAKEEALAKSAAKASVNAPKESEVKTEKKDEKLDTLEDDIPMDEEDLQLPSDLFGDDLFKMMETAGGLTEIDESALEDADKADTENDKSENMEEDDENSKASNELADALRDTLGPGFKLDSKDMEDLFSGMIEDPSTDPEVPKDQSKSDANAEQEPLQVPKTEPEEVPQQNQAQELPMTSIPQSQAPVVQAPNVQAVSQPQLQVQQQQQLPPQNIQPQQQQQQQQVPMSTMSMPLPSPSVMSPIVSAPVSMQSPVMYSQQQQQQQQPHQQQMVTQIQQGPMMTTRPQMPPQTQIQPPQMLPQPQQQPSMMNQAQGPQMMSQEQQQMMAQQRQLQMQRQHQQMMQERMAQQQQQQQQQQQIPAPPMGQTQMTPVLLRPQQPPFTQPPQQMRFPNAPPAAVAPSPYHQPDYQTPAALQGNTPAPVQLPQQPQPPPVGASPVQVQQWGPPKPDGMQGPPVGAIPSPVVPPTSQTPPTGMPPKPPTPSDTSSAQRNQLIKWESDEPLGDQATIAMILYSNQNHPNLKMEYPIWADRIKQIAKIWKNLPNDKRQPYVQQARENRTASRMNKQSNKNSKHGGSSRKDVSLASSPSTSSSPSSSSASNMEAAGTAGTDPYLSYPGTPTTPMGRPHMGPDQQQQWGRPMMGPEATSSEAATASSTGAGVAGGVTSQLQARLSQPPTMPPVAVVAAPNAPGAGANAAGNREQLRYLLQRGPTAASTAPATTEQISLSTATTSTGVTTTRVWVPETDNSLQPGMPPGMQQHRPQFRHPLPPDVRPQSPGVIRGMAPNVHVMNMRPRMMVQPQQRLPPGAAQVPPASSAPDGSPMQHHNNPAVTQQSPLLAQQLAGRPANPNMPPQQQQQHPQLQQQQAEQQHQQSADQNAEELEGLDTVSNELGDLGMSEEDLMGMGDNFDILEFADALDDLENLPENDSKKAAGGASASSSSETATPSTQPPPYSQAPTGINTPSQGGQIRAPPPPYPAGQQPPASTASAGPTGGPKEQPLLLEDLLEQEKREQQQQQSTPVQQQQQQQIPQHQQQQPVPQQQQPQQPPQQPQMPQMPQMQRPPMQQQQMPQQPQQMQQQMPVGAVLQQVRPQQQQMQGPPPGAFPVQQRPMIIQQGPPGMMQQGQWIRHPQEVTLQQRAGMPGQAGPPPQVMGIRGPGPPGMPGGPMLMDQHPALMRQDVNPQAKPPPLNTKPMTPPPENPQTDEDKAKVVRYEQWLDSQEKAINQQLKYYETEISKLRKLRKSLNSKQRTMRKNGNDLNEKDQYELDKVSKDAQEIQKTLERIRKQSKQHAMLTHDHRTKKEKAMGIDPASSQAGPGQMHPGQQQQQQMMMQQQPQMMAQQRMPMRPGMAGPVQGMTGPPRMMVLQQQQHQQQMGMRPGQPMQRMVMMQGHPGQRMVMMQQGQPGQGGPGGPHPGPRMAMQQGQPGQGGPGGPHPGPRMAMMRMPQGAMMRMQQPYGDQTQQGGPQGPPMNSPGMSPHNSSHTSPAHSMHSGQPSPQSYPVTSPGPGQHGRPGMTSPMSMPVTSPSPGMNVMSPMNPPSQSPQPVMSPQQFHHHQQQQHFSGSQSPATSVSQSPRNEDNPFSPTGMQQRPMNTVSPQGQGPPGSMSPSHQGPPRHGSPQPGMRPPVMMAGDQMMRGRFIRPTGAPGKEMRPRMVAMGPQGQRQPNFGPRTMQMRHGNPSPVYSGPMGSPAHQPQYGGGVSPQHHPQMQHQPQQQQMRPPSAGGSVTSPATDRPVTPQTPRTPGPPTPGHSSQPPTPGHPSQPPTPDQQQPFAQPSPQHIPHHVQPQFMQQQQHQQMQHHHQGGGGQGGPVPLADDDFYRRPKLRGGWGSFIGLKGGKPMDPNNGGQPAGQQQNMVVTAQMPSMAMVTSAPLMTNVAGASQQQQQQHPLVNTTNNSIAISTVESTLTAGGFTQVRPLQVTTTAIGGQTMTMQASGAGRPMAAPTSVIPTRPNLQQMPPSSAHQANVGIPGGFNPREAMSFQSLQGASYGGNADGARYPNPAGNQNKPISAASTGGNLSVPPMPPVVSTAALAVSTSAAVSDIKATVNLNCPVPSTNVLSTPLTTVPTIISSSGCVSSAAPMSSLNDTSARNALSSSTVGQSVMPTSVLQGAAPIASVPSLGVTLATSNAPMNATTVSTPGSNNAAGSTQEQQNALLKQLLSGSNSSTTSTTTQATSAEKSTALEAQLERPATAEFKQIPTSGLTTLATAIPQPNTQVSQAAMPNQQPMATPQPPTQPQQPAQQQILAIRPGGPPRPTQNQARPMGQATTRLNLPTVPVPEASLRPSMPNEVPHQRPIMNQVMPQQVQRQPRPMNPMQGQMIMTRPGMMQQQQQQQPPNLPQVPAVIPFQQGQQQPGQPQQMTRPMQVQMVQQQQPQPQQQQESGQQSSQLQGLLQQQTLVPQTQLASNQQPQQPQQQPQQAQPQFAQQQQPQQQFAMQIRGPQPRMRAMMPQVSQPGRPPMMHPQQQGGPPMQQMQGMPPQRFRQFRGPMPTSSSGEPLRPHFPPQQPMQVMRMSMNQMQQPGGAVPMQQQMVQGQPMMVGQHPMQSMQQMRPPPPGMATGSLRLSIPPQQQAMPPQPRTPGSTGSQQPSPALTPRSDMDQDMDSNSSRGTTPAPGDGFDGPDGFFSNGEPPQKVVKRRPSAQQKRRQSQSGMMMPGPPGPIPSKDIGGPMAKKRPRKGSRVDDSDYDSYLDSVMSQLKNLPPVSTVEPRLHHFYNACPVFGCGEMPKTFGYDLDTKFGNLEGVYGAASLPNEGDYYNTMPFGPEPPVPNIKTVTITAKGFYNQEFEPRGAERKHSQQTPSCMDSPSPDLFYSSSPEPMDSEPKVTKKLSNQTVWHDLEPDDSDEDEPIVNGPNNADNKVENGPDQDNKKGPPKILERPRSPFADLVVPIPIKPKPAQTITLNAIKNLDKENKDEDLDPVLKARAKSCLPPKQSKEVKSITLTLGNNSNKSVLRVLNGLSKYLNIEPPKQWMVEDKVGNTRDMFRCKIDNGVDSEPMETSVDLQTVLTSGAKFCRQCDTAVQANMVKKKTSELASMLVKSEKEEGHDEMYFCDENCYFKFAIQRTDQDETKDVKNLEQLAELQAKQKAIIKKEEATKDKENLDQAPKHKGVSYKTYTSSLLKSNKKYKNLSENELTALMFQIGSTIMPPREKEDTRACLFCHLTGDGPADGPARLLNYDVDKWVHLNCALWSEEVYETVSGALVNVETALKNGVNFYCKMCEKSGATVKCFKVRCTNYYHVGCATKDRAMFYKNKSVFCNQHVLKGEKDQELTTLAVYRRVFIERDENRQVAKVMTHGIDSQLLRIGSLTFISVGQLLPHQLHTFHTQDYIYPIGYKVIRNYWSLVEVNKRCPYTCSIGEVNNKPEFRVTTNVKDEKTGQEVEKTFVAPTAKAVWQQILVQLEKMRKESQLVKVFAKHITGEDLFGLNETNIIKVLESLPGIESLSDYTFKYGRNPLLELPLAVNPSGCARSEPQMRTRVKRVHNFQRTTGAGPSSGTKNALNRAAKEMVPTLIGLETTGPYSKNFVQSKSSQYRKMKQEWRQNVVLARSGIQGLGLYAARDLEKHQMIIEYIGEVIRSDLTDIREKRYEAQNRGIYMFRLDDERVLDATMCGGMARYINHSCDPNCVTETVEVDRDLHIIIFANRRILRGEELCYDYKFDFEDDNKIPCMCGAKNCCKWMN